MKTKEGIEMTYGEMLQQKLLDGTFKKNYRTNHGDKFVDGQDELRLYFNMYISSCPCYLMDMRIKRRKYCGD